MLLRLDAVVFGGRFAEVNELPDLPAKLGEIAVLVRERSLSPLTFISYNDINRFVPGGGKSRMLMMF